MQKLMQIPFLREAQQHFIRMVKPRPECVRGEYK